VRALVVVLVCLSSTALAQTAAVPWPDELCRKDEPWACIETGLYFARGGRDTEAIERFWRACEANDLEGCAKVSEMSQAKRGTGFAFAPVRERLKAACSKELPRACLALGHLHGFGIGQAVAPEAARKLYAWSCAKDPWTCSGLALQTQVGQGTPADEKRAAELYRKACDAKNARSGCRSLGEMLDDDAAFARACDGGDPVSCFALDRFERACTLGHSEACFEHGRALAAKQDLAKAGAAYNKACGIGQPSACGELGMLAIQGPEGGKALQLLEYACTNGYLRGCMALGSVLVQLKRSDAEVTRGVGLLRKACDGGDLEGCGGLGVTLVQGIGGKADPAAGVALVRKACDGGRVESCADLGVVYQKGLGGVKADAAEGKRLLAKACAAGHKQSCEAVKSADAAARMSGMKDMFIEGPQRAKALEAECDRNRDGKSCAEAAWSLARAMGNVKEQARLFAKACTMGHAPACEHAQDEASLDRGCNEHGSGKACERLGRNVDRKDPARSARLYARGCELGDGASCFASSGRAKAPEERMRLYRRACDLGDANGCEFMGNALKAAGKRAEARAAYERSCEASKHYDRDCKRAKELIEKLGP